MSAITPSIKTEMKFGPRRMILARFAAASDGDTWASGLNSIGSNPFFVAGGIGNPATQGSAGVHVEYATGTVTFRPGTDALGVDLLIII